MKPKGTLKCWQSTCMNIVKYDSFFLFIYSFPTAFAKKYHKKGYFKQSGFAFLKESSKILENILSIFVKIASQRTSYRSSLFFLDSSSWKSCRWKNRRISHINFSYYFSSCETASSPLAWFIVLAGTAALFWSPKSSPLLWVLHSSKWSFPPAPSE